MELLAARVDGAQSVVGVSWRRGRNTERGFDTMPTRSSFAAPRALQ